MPGTGTTPPRTSAAQLQRIVSVVRAVIRASAAHISSRRGVYGFLLGSLSTLATLALIVVYGLLAFPPPWKTTDPSDPRFNPAAFRFTDYSTSRDLEDALEAVIPVGTPKAVVDDQLRQAGARMRPYRPAKREKQPPNLYYYSFANLRSHLMDVVFMAPPGETAWEAGIYYDDHDRVQRIVGISP